MANANDKRMSKAILSLGSNLGNRRNNLLNAHSLLEKKIAPIFSISNIYETESWGISKLNPFLNEVLIIETTLNEIELLSQCQKIEKQLGKKKNQQNKVKGEYKNRIIDIDLIYFASFIIEADDLVIPHPRLHLRRFVLEPLKEIAPEWIHPILKKNTVQLLMECSDNNEVRLYD